MENDFLKKITHVIEENISDELFGVSELANEVGMSRSNLLRKVKQMTNLSVSQFIRNVRLQHAKKMLKGSSLTVSEISYQVGFSSVSYFIKCFRDLYGYPPGEEGKRDETVYQPQMPLPPHQLAAIMFTDIQGYTALMQQDEEKAIRLRKRHREVFEAVTEKFNGKILQYYGDGTLSTFNSAIDAVKCGIEMQLTFREEPKIPVRVGIHTGDIMFTDDGIVGDGVNVASRIESLAAVQSVFISEKVYDEVKNQPGIRTTSMGKFELKNVDRPMEVFAIANPGLIVPDRDQVYGNARRKPLDDPEGSGSKRKSTLIKWGLIISVAILIGVLAYQMDLFEKPGLSNVISDPSVMEKSIAVLPFINDSNDSSNIYIVNGLMDATLTNLQKIRDLRVISRTSVEKYRNQPKSISEIGRELNVHYLIEGSGQKIGNQIMLHIQLIDATNDQHVWAEQYKREAKDIFDLQTEVAKNITDHIEVIITPEEKERISKPPTDDPVAYDYFLKGLDRFYKLDAEGLKASIPYFKKAIERDMEFARAYADVAIAVYLLDAGHTEKAYSDTINYYADQALLYDGQLPQSLIAKALYYMYNEDYNQAQPYLEKALEYNPNSATVVNALSDFYARVKPNTAKYLEYALKGIQLDAGGKDSVTTSNMYLHLSNALIQTGFVDEALDAANKSLAYNPENPYTGYVKAFIHYAKNGDLKETKRLLVREFSKDTTRLDILQEIGKICYYQRDYKDAYKYYKKLIDIKKEHHLNIYRHENAKMGLVLAKMGMMEDSKAYFADFKDFAENDKSIYHHLHLVNYYSYMGDTQKAIEELRLFSQEDNYFYWILLFLKKEPLLDNIVDKPEFKKVYADIERKFEREHERIKVRLEEQGLI